MSVRHLAMQTLGSEGAEPTGSHAGSIPGRLGAEASAWTVDVFGIVLPALLLAAALACAVGHYGRIRAALATGRRKTPIKVGRVLLSGEVEADGEPGPVVMLSIDQAGREAQSRYGMITQQWTETGRRLTLRPFYLLLPSGERVRVEPDFRTRLVGKLDKTEPVDLAHRIRVAEVRPGARITVSGVLAHGHDPGTPGEGYRGSGEGFVLRPPPGGRLRIAPVPAGAQRFARAAFHLKWAAAILFAVVALHGGLFLHFHLLRTSGHVVMAEVTGVRTVASPAGERGGSRAEPRLFMDARYTDPQGRKHDLAGQTNAEAMHAFDSERERGHTMRMPFLWVPSMPFIHQAGAHPTIESYKRGVALFIVLTLALMYGIHAWYTRPWHARRRLVEADQAQS